MSFKIFLVLPSPLPRTFFFVFCFRFYYSWCSKRGRHKLADLCDICDKADQNAYWIKNGLGLFLKGTKKVWINLRLQKLENMEELRDFIFSTNYWHCKNNVGDKLDNWCNCEKQSFEEYSQNFLSTLLNSWQNFVPKPEITKTRRRTLIVAFQN